MRCEAAGREKREHITYILNKHIKNDGRKSATKSYLEKVKAISEYIL